MKTELSLELDLQIKFSIHAAEPKTWDYPGCPADCEILDIKIYGQEISGELFDKIIKEYGPEIEEWCCDHAADEYKSGLIDRAEYQMELRREAQYDR